MTRYRWNRYLTGLARIPAACFSCRSRNSFTSAYTQKHRRSQRCGAIFRDLNAGRSQRCAAKCRELNAVLLVLQNCGEIVTLCACYQAAEISTMCCNLRRDLKHTAEISTLGDLNAVLQTAEKSQRRAATKLQRFQHWAANCRDISRLCCKLQKNINTVLQTTERSQRCAATKLQRSQRCAANYRDLNAVLSVLLPNSRDFNAVLQTAEKS